MLLGRRVRLVRLDLLVPLGRPVRLVLRDLLVTRDRLALRGLKGFRALLDLLVLLAQWVRLGLQA